ncbi:MAG: DUF2169 domain-containing protein, partial [Myxococcota bacterium]
PRKAAVDVTVVGKAYAPPGELARMVAARVKVGTVDKSVQVWADRYMRRDGRIREKKFFSKMSLGYEKAAGGPGSDNPVGLALVEGEDGRIVLPNVQRPGDIPTLGTPMASVGLGPLPATWPSRERMLGPLDRAWLERAWEEAPAPPQFPWDFFQAAPADQRMAELADDEAIRLECLHPEQPVLETKLPGVTPAVFLESADGAQPLSLKADTLWIDTNRLRLTLCWRGTAHLEHPSDVRRIVVGQAPLTWARAVELADASAREPWRSFTPSSRRPAPATRADREPDSVTHVRDDERVPPPKASGRMPQHTVPIATRTAPPVVTVNLEPRHRDMVAELGEAWDCTPEEVLRRALVTAWQKR